jgi:plasmid stability protein
MSAELAGKAYVEMSVKGREDFAKAFSDMQSSVQTFAARLNAVRAAPNGAAMTKFFKSAKSEFGDLIKIATKYGAVVGAAVGVTAVAAFSRSISKASDLQETMNKFSVVFGDQATYMEQWATTFAKSVGRSKQEVLDFMSQAQGLVIPMGIDPAEAGKMSQTLAQLSFDLARFHNSTDAEAFEALRSALTGEAEPMKKFGVIVNETAVKAELLKKGLDPTTATEAQKAMARYNIILEGTKQAQGDVERSGDSFANRMKALQASFDDLSAGIGTQFLPVAEALLGWLTELVQSLGDTTGASNDTAKMLEEFGGASQIASDSVGYLVKAFSLVDLAFNMIMGTGRELIRMMLSLFKLMVNNPLSRGAFGKETIDNLVKIIDEVDKATAKLEEANQQRALAAWDTLMDPQAGEKAIGNINDFVKAQKEKFEVQREQLRKAREEAQKEAAAANQPGRFERVILKAKGVPSTAAADAAKAQADMATKAVSVASPQTLESTSLAAFERFRENANNEQRQLMEKQLAEQQKIAKALQNPDLTITEFE